MRCVPEALPDTMLESIALIASGAAWLAGTTVMARRPVPLSPSGQGALPPWEQPLAQVTEGSVAAAATISEAVKEAEKRSKVRMMKFLFGLNQHDYKIAP